MALRSLLAVAVPITLLALAGTGQRTFLVLAVLALGFGLSTLLTVPKLKAAALLGVALAIFGVISVYLGRADVLSPWAVAEQLGRRVFYEEQFAGWVAFRYVADLDTAWFTEWAMGLAGVSPWHSGSDLDSRVFEVLHGSRRGTANLSTVASAYHNGGIVGVSGLFFLMGWSYVAVYFRFLRGRRTPLRSVGYGALVIHLATFVSGSPTTLLNRGLPAVIFLLVLRRFRFRRATVRDPVRQQGQPSSTSVQAAELA
jgi:hypothetical protein